MRIVIVGAGAVGGVVGQRLIDAGRDVTFCTRPARSRQLRQCGLQVTSGAGITTTPCRTITADEARDGELPGFDLVVIAVKAPALAHVVSELSATAGATSIVVPLLNGMAHLATLREAYGSRLVGGVARLSAYVTGDGVIRLLAPDVSLVVGSPDGAHDAESRAVQALTVPGVAVRRTDDIVAAMWAKWIRIASIGALNILLGGSISDVTAQPGGQDVAETVLGEAVAIAESAGMSSDDLDLSTTRGAVTAPRRPTTTSLYRDLQSGRQTETDHILADLIARGRRGGVSTPVLDRALAMVRDRERRRDT